MGAVLHFGVDCVWFGLCVCCVPRIFGTRVPDALWVSFRERHPPHPLVGGGANELIFFIRGFYSGRIDVNIHAISNVDAFRGASTRFARDARLGRTLKRFCGIC